MKRQTDRWNWKRIGDELLGFAIFVFLVAVIIMAWQGNKIEKQEKEIVTAIIYDKTAEKHLSSGLTYVVLLQPGLLEKTRWQLPPSDWSTVSKSEFEALEIGDRIDGYVVDDAFYQPHELKGEDRLFYIMLGVLGMYPFAYICHWLFKIKKVDEFFDRHDFGIGLIIYIVFWGGLFVFLFFMYREMAADLKNGYEKFYGKDYIETVATVTDYYTEHGSGRDYQRYYYLALAYEDESGEQFHLTKEVRRNTYLNALTGELPINYQKENPYNAFAQKTETKDIINFLTSRDMWLHFLIVTITALLSYALFLMNRKRRTGSYWR